MSRKLASIQEIIDIKPIKDADFIECVSILGWKCVVEKKRFVVNEKCVYFEVDSFLPICNKFEFLRKSSYRNNEYMGEGFRLKTQKFRGQISQGLVLPLSILPEGNYEVGDDVTTILDVSKWDMPETAMSSGTAIGEIPHGIHKTDEIRIQSLPELLNEIGGLPYYISTKMDGTSVTKFIQNGVFGVCGRRYEYKDDGNCDFWKYAHKNNLVNKFKAYGRNIAVQGEMCGGGIQKNRLQLKEPHWYVFNVFDIDNQKYLDFAEFVAICKELDLETVPIEEKGETFNYKTIEELLQRGKGNYKSGQKKEGIVVRPLFNKYSNELSGNLSFKVLNNDFLLKQKD